MTFEAGLPGAGAHAAVGSALVVDDSAGQRRLLTRMLESWGYVVTEAASGEEALARSSRVPPDLVLSDWMMPGMDGLEFCRRFRARGARGYSYFILLTSKTGKSDVAAGLDAGADDFLSKPVSVDELRARVNAGARLIAMQRELGRTSAQLADTVARLQKVHEAMDRDLRQARRIQEALIPETCLDLGTSRLSLFLKPCGHVGGDLVGMLEADRDQIGFYGIDVSGHGITSAMMTARIAGYLSQGHPEQNLAFCRTTDGRCLRSPEAVARILNDRLIAEPAIDEYLTMALAVLDMRTGGLRLVQAGHPRPLLLRADGRAVFLGSGGLPIGLLPDARHEAVSLVLDPGDRVLIYSDGFTEAAVRGVGQLGEAGLLSLVRACSADLTGSELLEELFWRLIAGMPEGHGLDDDVSAALFEYDCYDTPAA